MNQIDDNKSRVEVRPSRIAVVRDDFDQGLNPNFWSTQKIESGRLTFHNLGNISVAQIELKRGDRQEVNKFGTITERDELLEHRSLQLPLGVDSWYAFSFFFPEDFPIVDNRTVFAQWKQRTPEAESPFLSFRYQGGELVCKVIGEDVNEKFRPKQKEELRGQWHRILMNYRLDENQTGKVHCRLDDKELVNYEGKMGYHFTDPSTYFKMGLYRDQIDTPQIIYLAQYRRGPSQEDCSI